MFVFVLWEKDNCQNLKKKKTRKTSAPLYAVPPVSQKSFHSLFSGQENEI